MLVHALLVHALCHIAATIPSPVPYRRIAVLPASRALECSPISPQKFISFNNIPNIVRYVYEKPPCNNRKCG